MTRTGLSLAAAVVVVSNLWALGLAAVNRQDEPQATLQLTERELGLVSARTENSAMSLRLKWTDPSGRREAGWFDRAKLEELGFDCSRPIGRENAKHYRTMPARRAYVAMEYDGPAWQRYVAALPAGADSTTAEGLSHLVLVDVARDAARLRARHPDRTRVVVAQAVVRIVAVQDVGGPRFLKGQVLEVLPMELNVPRDLRRTLDPLVATTARPRATGPAGAAPLPHAPRYVATVRWGRSLEPWIDAVHAAENQH
jgi:hypothetical protein